MQVKKFEAKTMQDALKMVKRELGPEAIILAARDNSRGFGLLSQGSVEITAAISENTLRKKKYVESRLRDEDREKLALGSAATQRQFSDKVVERFTAKVTENRKELTQINYASIIDEEETVQVAPRRGQNSTPAPERARLPPPPPPQESSPGLNASAASERIKAAAQSAWAAGQVMITPPAQPPRVQAKPQAPSEIQTLQQEIQRLQKMLKDMNHTPGSPAMSLHPGAAFGLPYEMNFMFEKLSASGVDSELADEILKSAQKELSFEQAKKKPVLDAYTARWILDRTQISDRGSQKGVHLFVGPNGSGKTSSLIKMASHLVIQKKASVAILTTDTFKLGAADQLRIFCKILNVPFAIVRQVADWSYLLSQLHSKVDYILCDFPGLQMRDMEDIDLLRSLFPEDGESVHKHLVLSATTKDKDCYQLLSRYKMSKFQDVIFTNLDQSTQHGVLLNVSHKFHLPLHSFGTGPGIPEDFEWATKERVLDLIFKLSSFKSRSKNR